MLTVAHGGDASEYILWRYWTTYKITERWGNYDNYGRLKRDNGRIKRIVELKE